MHFLSGAGTFAPGGRDALEVGAGDTLFFAASTGWAMAGARGAAQGVRERPMPTARHVHGLSRASQRAAGGLRDGTHRAAGAWLTARVASRDGRCPTPRSSCKTACPAHGRG
ncbi:hypothetical protein [Burkholderia stagnalis]